MRLACLILLSFFIVSCWSDNLEQSSKEIIDNINDRNYSVLWDEYLEDNTKINFTTDFILLKEHQLGLQSMSMIGVPDDKFKTITAEEYFSYLLVFAMNMTDLFSSNTDNLTTRLEIIGVDKIGDDRAIIRWKNATLTGNIYLARLDKRWYINIEED